MERERTCAGGTKNAGDSCRIKPSQVDLRERRRMHATSTIHLIESARTVRNAIQVTEARADMKVLHCERAQGVGDVDVRCAGNRRTRVKGVWPEAPERPRRAGAAWEDDAGIRDPLDRSP